MTVTESGKAKQFRTLHEAPGAFVIANVWAARHGCSSEDASGNPDAPIHEIGLATERLVAAARALPFPITLTGRTENILAGGSIWRIRSSG